MNGGRILEFLWVLAFWFFIASVFVFPITLAYWRHNERLRADDTGAYIIDDGDGPEMWRQPDDARLVPLPVLTKERLRIAMWSDSGFILGDAYLADVDKVWSVIADAVERGDL